MADAPAALSSAPAKIEMTEPLLRMTGDQQALSRRAGARRRRPRSRPPARSTRCSARTAPASRRCSRSCPARSSPTRARSSCSASRSPSRRRTTRSALGIVTIYQEFTLAPNMTIAENVFIGREPGSKLFVSWRQAGRRDAGDHRAASASSRRPDDAGARSLGRRAADGRDRPRAVDEVAADRHGRADLGASAKPRSRSCSRIVRDLKARGPVDHLRHPSARGSDPHLRPLHRAARRPLRRHRHASPTPTSTASSGMMVGREVDALFGDARRARARARSRSRSRV